MAGLILMFVFGFVAGIGGAILWVALQELKDKAGK